MNILIILAYIYFGIGFLYALYILLFGQDPWYWFPINLILAPIIIVYDAYLVWQRHGNERRL